MSTRRTPSRSTAFHGCPRLSVKSRWSAELVRGVAAREGDTAAAPELDPVAVEGTHFDLAGQVAAGDVVGWWVRARDAWGAGEPSETSTFIVLSTPEPQEPEVRPAPKEPEGCSATGAPRTAWVLVRSVLLAGRRRRTS